MSFGMRTGPGWFSPEDLPASSPLRAGVGSHTELQHGGFQALMFSPRNCAESRGLVVNTEAKIPPEEALEGIRQGDSGPKVRRVQKILQRWNKGLGVRPHGTYDQTTRDALTLFKAIYGKGGSGAQIDRATAHHLRQMEDGTFWHNPPKKSLAQATLYHASRELGKPYRLGGNGKNSIDCGLLTAQAFRRAGGSHKTSRLADMQYLSARQGTGGLQFQSHSPEAGDFIFYRVPTRQSGISYDGVTHVTLYVGDGLMLAASSAAGRVILQPTRQLHNYEAGFGRPKPGA